MFSCYGWGEEKRMKDIIVNQDIAEYLFDNYEEIAKQLAKGWKADTIATNAENHPDKYQDEKAARDARRKFEYIAARHLLTARNMAKNEGIRDLVEGYIDLSDMESIANASAAVGSAVEMIVRRKSEAIALAK